MISVVSWVARLAASGSLSDASFSLQGFRISPFQDMDGNSSKTLSVYDATAKNLSVAAGRV